MILHIFEREIKNFFYSFFSFCISFLFFFSNWLIFWVFKDFNIIDHGYSTLNNYFLIVPYILIFFISAISINSFCYEKKNLTLILLKNSLALSKDIVLGKFFSNFFISTSMLICTLPYYFFLFFFSTPIGSIDSAATFSSFFCLILMNSTFCSLSLFFSSFSENQIFCFLTSLFFCFFLYDGFESLKDLFNWSFFSSFFSKIGMKNHYLLLSKGVLKINDISYFFFINYIFLFFTKKRFESFKC